MKVKDFMADLSRRFPNEPEYLQAVEEVVGPMEAQQHGLPRAAQ